MYKKIVYRSVYLKYYWVFPWSYVIIQSFSLEENVILDYYTYICTNTKRKQVIICGKITHGKDISVIKIALTRILNNQTFSRKYLLLLCYRQFLLLQKVLDSIVPHLSFTSVLGHLEEILIFWKGYML